MESKAQLCGSLLRFETPSAIFLLLFLNHAQKTDNNKRCLRVLALNAKARGACVLCIRFALPILPEGEPDGEFQGRLPLAIIIRTEGALKSVQRQTGATH
jgi:hypothetical protein